MAKFSDLSTGNAFSQLLGPFVYNTSAASGSITLTGSNTRTWQLTITCVGDVGAFLLPVYNAEASVTPATASAYIAPGVAYNFNLEYWPEKGAVSIIRWCAEDEATDVRILVSVSGR